MNSILFTELTPSEQETLQGGLLGIIGNSDSKQDGNEGDSEDKSLVNLKLGVRAKVKFGLG